MYKLIKEKLGYILFDFYQKTMRLLAKIRDCNQLRDTIMVLAVSLLGPIMLSFSIHIGTVFKFFEFPTEMFKLND